MRRYTEADVEWMRRRLERVHLSANFFDHDGHARGILDAMTADGWRKLPRPEYHTGVEVVDTLAEARALAGPPHGEPVVPGHPG